MAPIEALWKQTLGASPDWDSLSGEDSFKPPLTTGAPPSPAPTTALDEEDFVTLAELGRGGMGTVYRARQSRLRRIVALKKMRGRGPDPAAAFTAEALLCAGLEHPNIVPIHDLAGSPEDELMLAMKLVEGESWRQLLTREPDARERHLEILLQLCNAVSFAHSRGVVHNDIKPANVMLGAYGEVLLVDWGVAVELAEPAGPKLRPAASLSAPCGTPCYMPPELARGDGPAIGPWTDTYLLGAVLYHILHGRAPRTGQFRLAIEAAAAGRLAPLDPALPEELRRICSRALAPEPADRYQQAGELRAALSDWLRHRESEKISAAARAQLDGLPELERESRYRGYAEALAGFRHAASLWDDNPTARAGRQRAHLGFAREALTRGDLGLAASQVVQLAESGAGAEADELRAALDGARRQRAAQERTRKLQRRLLRGAALTLLTGLLAALGIFAWQNGVILERNAEIRGNLAEIELQKADADSARATAEDRGAIAQQAYADLVFGVQTTLVEDAQDARSLSLAEDFLGLARDGLQRLAETELASGGLSRVTAVAMLQLAVMRFDAGASAEDTLRDLTPCREVFAALVRAQPDDASLRERLAFCDIYRARALARQHQRADAIALLEEALRALEPSRDDPQRMRTRIELLCELASVEQAEQLLDRAHSRATSAVVAAETLYARIPTRDGSEPLVVALSKRALVLKALGHINEACADAERQLALQEERWAARPENARQSQTLLRCCLQAGELQLRLGRHEAGEASYLRAKELAGLLVQRAPLHRESQEAWANAVQRLAVLYRSRHDFARAVPLHAENVATRRRIALLSGDDPTRQLELARALHQSALTEKLQGKLAEARSGMSEVLRLVTGLDTNAVKVRATWQDTESELAEILSRLDEPQEALVRGRRALRLAEEMLERDPDSAQAVRLLSLALSRCALAAEKLGQLEQSVAWYETCHALRAELHARAPEDRQAQRDLAVGLINLGRLRAATAGPEAALACFAESIALNLPLAEEDPRDSRLRKELIDCLIACVRRAAEADQPVAAEQWLERTRERLAPATDNPDVYVRYAYSLNMLGDAWLRAGEPNRACAPYREMLALLGENLAARPEDQTLQREFAVASGRLGDALWAAGDAEAARAEYEQALALQRGLLQRQPSDGIRRYELSFYLHKLAVAGSSLEVRRDHGLEELELLRGLAAQIPDHPLVRQARITALEQLFLLHLRLDERAALRACAAELAACLAQDARQETLDNFRSRLQTDPELSWLREAEDFATWWEELPE